VEAYRMYYDLCTVQRYYTNSRESSLVSARALAATFLSCDVLITYGWGEKEGGKVASTEELVGLDLTCLDFHVRDSSKVIKFGCSVIIASGTVAAVRSQRVTWLMRPLAGPAVAKMVFA
jgi:hypothetical protein